MKKTIAILLALCLCIGLCACGGNSGLTEANPASEPKVKFESAKLMQESVDGVWMNCKTGDYLVIKNGILSIFDEESKQTKMNILKDQLNNLGNFENFYLKHLELTGENIEYSYENGSIKLTASGQIYFTLHDNESAFGENSVMFTKNAISEDELKDELTADFINLKYPNAATNKDVQFDKYGHLGKYFIISGTAELDDYYNWGYTNYEASSFCIRIRPTGENYSDEWYIYASRSDFATLFESLKSGSKTIKIVAKLIYADTGTNNMATLIEFF